MSDVAELISRKPSASEFFAGYVELLTARLRDVDFKALAKVVDALEKTRKQHGWIYLAGNGGSAATAMHWANDLRAIPATPSFKSQALSANASVLTCIGNDIDFRQIFATQIRGRINANDLLVLLSASGESPNILEAATTAKANNTPVVAVVGFDGGSLHELADLSICVHTNQGDYGIVEDAHLALAHMVSNFLRLTA